MKTKKKAIKLKELSVLHRENNQGQKWSDSAEQQQQTLHAQSGTSLLEGFVDGPEPAHIGTWSKEDEPQDCHAKVGRSATSTHPCQAANQINS